MYFTRQKINVLSAIVAMMIVISMGAMTVDAHTDRSKKTKPTTVVTTAIQVTTTAPTTVATTAPTTAPTTVPENSLPAAEHVYYVDPAGSDTGTGSALSPFKTIQNAINKATANTLIVVKSGQYNEKLKISGKTGLAIVNAPSEKPVITGAGFTSGYLVSIETSSDIQFSGFDLTGFSAADFEMIYIKNGSNDIEISNCVIHDFGVTTSSGNAHAILAKSTTDTVMRRIQIKNNTVFNSNTGYSEAITVQGNVDGFEVMGNTIHDGTNIGIDIAGFYNNTCTDPALNQARNGLVSGNLVYNLYCPYATCAGIYVDGGRDTVIENNIVHDSMCGIEVGCENAFDYSHPTYPSVVSGIVVRNNLIYNNSKTGLGNGGYDGTNTGKVINTQIYNNTFYKNNFEIILDYCDNVSITRNIIVNPGSGYYYIYNGLTGMATNIMADDNVYYGSNGSGKYKLNGKYAYSLTEWQSKFALDLNSRFVDPQFADPASGNFSLTASSPVTGYGANLS